VTAVRSEIRRSQARIALARREVVEVMERWARQMDCVNLFGEVRGAAEAGKKLSYA
jgi:hypothetical protein